MQISSRQPRLVRILLSALLAAALIGMPAVGIGAQSAHADVQGIDMVSDRSVSERGLGVGSLPDVNAASAILFTSDGTILWSRNADDIRSEASITKLMTAVVALEHMGTEDVITVTEGAFEAGPSSTDLAEGAQLTLGTLLFAMLVNSDNCAAEAIAIGVAGTEENFTAMMNDKAAELGMGNTHFENPHGLDEEGHVTTVRDLTILTRYAMGNPMIRSIVCIPQMEIDVGHGPQLIENTNDLLTTLEGCIGIKTGTEDSAGYCVAVACSRNGLELYCVVLGSESDSTRFTSAANLIEWGYAHYIPINLCNTTDTVALVPHSQWTDRTVPVACADAQTVYVLDYDNAICQDISTVEVTGDVHAGDVLGTITWTQGDRVIATSSLVATEDVKKPNIFQRFGIWCSRTFTHKPEVADLDILVEPVQIQDPETVVPAAA